MPPLPPPPVDGGRWYPIKSVHACTWPSAWLGVGRRLSRSLIRGFTLLYVEVVSRRRCAPVSCGAFVNCRSAVAATTAFHRISSHRRSRRSCCRRCCGRGCSLDVGRLSCWPLTLVSLPLLLPLERSVFDHSTQRLRSVVTAQRSGVIVAR